jgi:hypothetical protein
MVDLQFFSSLSSRAFAYREQTPLLIEELSAHIFGSEDCQGDQKPVLEYPPTQADQGLGFGDIGHASLRDSSL